MTTTVNKQKIVTQLFTRLDSTSTRVLHRMGTVHDLSDLEAMRTSVKHQVRKAKASQFVDTISELADTHCSEADPCCPGCPLRNFCMTGLECKKPPPSMK